MNDNDKFKKFFGFGGDSNEQAAESSHEPVLSEKEALEKANATIAEWTDKYLTLTADFENYKKRVSSERADWANEAQKRIVLDLLTVIDNFERALEQEKKRESAEAQALLAGFTMIYQSLEKLLVKFGVQAITDLSTFNPKYHEALMQVESDTHKSGEIVQVLQKGYTMHDKVIRPATVSVAK
ncbi:MAG TPA: nucleotide exchange factor GrpE [Candidatus Babeliales bacterium]|nr:nucleotide exchange factor GrpE [Candidatus Babeliales bacterium]